MSIMYGQVCGRKRNGEQITVEPNKIKSEPRCSEVRVSNAKKQTKPSERKIKASETNWQKREYNKLKAEKKATKEKLSKIEVKRNEIACTQQTNSVLRSAKCEPEIGSYHRQWANKYIYVEICEDNRKLFDRVADAVDYINAHENTDELTESWLSFLLTNRIPKYRIYTVGLVDKDFTNRALRQLNEREID